METNVNPLIEYFYLFGLSTETIKKPEYYRDNNFLRPEFLKPNLLSKFPPINKPNVDIDPNIIIYHCFPKGFKLLESLTIPKDEIFHFSIDNVPSRHTKNKNVYYTCLLFYESLKTYYNIQTIINKDLLNSHKNNGDDIRSKGKKFTVDPKTQASSLININFLFDNYYSPKVICFCSFIPFPYEFQYLLKKLKNYCLGTFGKITIPIEKIIENLVITIPRPIRGRFNVKIKKDYFLLNGENNDLDITQCHFNEYSFHSYKFQSIFEFSIDDIIEIYKSLLLEIPLLFFCNDKEKLTNIVHSFLELLSPFKYQYPNVSILPDDYLGIIEYSKSFVFGINQDWIDPESKENFFERKKILIFNKPIRICVIENDDKSKLDLYYNEKEEGSVITFEELGKINTNTNNDNTINSISDTSINNNNTDINNINSSTIKINEYNSDLIGCQLPVHYTEKLKKKLKSEKEKIDNNKNKNEYDPQINKVIGEETFYYFLASVFQNYNTFLFNTEKEVQAINEEIFTKTIYNIPMEKMFKIADFLYDNKREDAKFLTSFVNTNIFRNFLGRKYLNSENDKFLFLHFDETILTKKNKNFFNKKLGTEFIGEKDLKTNSWYILDKSNNPTRFTKEEISIMKEKKKHLVFYYQSLGDSDFKYILFPILLYDNYFFNNAQYQIINYFTFSNTKIKMCLSGSIDILNKLQNAKLFNIYNTEVLTQYKNNPAKTIYPNEIVNSIYLLWLRVFCMTFYYCDKNEKYLRFYEMLKVIRKTKQMQDNILSLILATLAKYGDEYMVITFFENINNFTYGDYAYLANKLISMKDIKARNIILKKMPISNTGLILFYYIDIKEPPFNFPSFSGQQNQLSKNVKNRTFFSGNNNNSTNDEIEYMRFDNSIICNNCNYKLDIAKLTISFGNMTKFENIKCQNCKQEFQPQIKVRLGENYYFSIKLYGPYFLYNDLSSNLLNVYGTKLNLDELREKNEAFLYNCCWYFNINAISYNMMFKYKNSNKSNNIKRDDITQNKKGRKKRFTSLEIIKTNE